RRRTARLGAVSRWRPGRGVARGDRSSSRPRHPSGARHRGKHAALLQRALSSRVRRALARPAARRRQVFLPRHGEPERARVRARPFGSGDPPLERDDTRTIRQPRPGARASGESTAMSAHTSSSDTMAALRRQYGCGPIELTGNPDALYERHLFFDNVIDPAAATAREHYEAFAHSVRDVLSQRWVRTEQTYDRVNPKRIYYLSMEFLIGRSLSNNVTNLLLSPIVDDKVKQTGLDWLGLLEEEPDAGLGNGGLGRLAACFLDSMATMQLPAIGYGLRYEYGMFRQSIENGWQHEQGDNWLRRPDPWEIVRPDDRVEIRMNCSIALRNGTMIAIPGLPSTLIGIPYDRPVVGYGGK